MSNPSGYAANIAQTLTNLVQENGNIRVRGHAYSKEPYVEVRWAWLSFPVTLVVIGLLALIATVWETHQHRMPLWRSSPLPLLFNYQDDSMRVRRDQDGDERGVPPVDDAEPTGSGSESNTVEVEHGRWRVAF